ncbi:MAG: hypothetical protein C5B50_25900, partial [Verrucomicrobia bacterium]
YNKTNGQNVKRISDLKFWANAGLVLASSDIVSDPRIVYDPTSQRWFASMVDADSSAADPTLESNDFLLAVSATSDPRGTWHGFLFEADPDTGTFADFPTLGVDANAVYLSGDMYQGMDNPLGPSLWSFPKADLLMATPTISNATFFGVMSYSQRGDVLQPVNCLDGSASGLVLATTDIGNDTDPHSNLVSFAVLNASQPGASLTTPVFIPTAPWIVPYNSDLGVPQFAARQPDATQTLQANDARLGAKVYAVGGTLYAVNNTLLNNHIAIRWYRVRAADNTLLESGMIADTNLDLYFPSIAANPYGVVVLSYQGSGLGTNGNIGCYAQAGQTVNGVTTFGSRLLLQASTSSYHDLYEQLSAAVTSRWGDYTTTSVDAANPNSFWTIQMYSSDGETWTTQITQLITTPQPVLGIQKAGTNVLLSWQAGATGYQLQSATNFHSPVAWTNVTQLQFTNGNQLSVTVPISGNAKYFRLQHP